MLMTKTRGNKTQRPVVLFSDPKEMVECSESILINEMVTIHNNLVSG